MSDVIDLLVGINPGSRLDRIRAARQQARDNAQASYDALFVDVDETSMTLEERFAVAVFVAGLHAGDPEIAFYAGGFVAVSHRLSLLDAVKAEAAAQATAGPYGRFPAGPLSAEDQEGSVYRASETIRDDLGARLTAALEHAHFLVFRPRDAAPDKLQALLDAGWSTTGIVTLSQLVAFLSFQLRVIAGLRVIAALPEANS